MSESTDSIHDPQRTSLSSSSEPQTLTEFLAAWLSIESMKEGQAYLETHRERLLSQEVLDELDHYLTRRTEDSDLQPRS